MFERGGIEEMFAATRAHPNVRWDIDGVCLWGYYFLGGNAEQLEAAGRELAKRGFRVVSVDPGSSAYALHVERVEQHTVDSLMARNAEFDALASEFGLDAYDGMDVGPVPGGGPA